MPTPWSLRRRRPGPAPDEDTDALQARYTARLESLFGAHPELDAPPGDEVPADTPATPEAAPDPMAPSLRPATLDASPPRDPDPPAAGARTARRGAATAEPLVAAACPYCAVLLQPVPDTSRRCPRCRQRIVVRRDAGRVVLLTEAAVPVFESERRRAADHGRFVHARDRWLRLAAAAGAPAARVRRLGDGYASAASVDAARALYMSACDRAFRAAKRDRRWDRAERIRRDEAATLHRVAGRPVPPSPEAVAVYREGVASRLRSLTDLVQDVEMAAASCCDVCASHAGRTVQILSELGAPTLPHPGCPAGLCRCRWVIAERDVVEARRRARRKARASTTDR